VSQVTWPCRPSLVSGGNPPGGVGCENAKTGHLDDCGSGCGRTTMMRMPAVVEAPQIESWFLVDWLSAGRPGVLMEFRTREEARTAMRAALGDAARTDQWRFRLTVRSALAMMQDPELRDALAAWDLQFAEG
jgi:hypothetical protein